jgi:large subunit ribosomal protein L1
VEPATTPAASFTRGQQFASTSRSCDNIQTFINFVLGLKPASVKGNYLKGIAISATMSPGVRVAV